MPAMKLEDRVRGLEAELELTLRMLRDVADGLVPSPKIARQRWEQAMAYLAAPAVKTHGF